MTNKQLTAMFNRWITRLHLSTWLVRLIPDASLPAHGVCEAKWEYKEATIYLNPGKIKQDGAEIEDVLVHELVHVLLSGIPVQEGDVPHLLLERTTEELTQILLGAYA